MTRVQAQSALGLMSRANFRERYIEPSLAAGLIEMAFPDKPRSSKQRYRITEAGLAVLRECRGGSDS